MLIEPIVIAYLHDKGIDDVYVEIPANHPASFVTLQKVDSQIEDHINGITFEVCSYAPTKLEAMTLDDEVKKAFFGDGVNSYGIVELAEISACKYGGGSDAPATTTKSQRYRSYINLFY